MASNTPPATQGEKLVTEYCGLVMPISPTEGYPLEHWSDVKNIVSESVLSISEPKFEVRLVSDADDVGVIHRRIVQNIYNAGVVVCDVSSRNPNVMFELGLCLAFDKPTVIVKDDKTEFAFDTGVIEHVQYPKDLRFSRIVEFKSVLAKKVSATYKFANSEENHSTFLKNFGPFQIAQLNQEVVPAEKLAMGLLQDMQSEMFRMRKILSDLTLQVQTVLPIAKFAASSSRFGELSISNKATALLDRFRQLEQTERRDHSSTMTED